MCILAQIYKFLSNIKSVNTQVNKLKDSYQNKKLNQIYEKTITYFNLNWNKWDKIQTNKIDQNIYEYNFSIQKAKQ